MEQALKAPNPKLTRREALTVCALSMLLGGDEPRPPVYERPHYPRDVEVLRPEVREVLVRLGDVAIRQYTTVAETPQGQRFTFDTIPPVRNGASGMDSAFFVPAEYANGHSASAIVRACVARELSGREGPIVLLRNDDWGHDNLNFTHEERQQLADGDAGPFFFRADAALAKVLRGSVLPVQAMGFSLGAASVVPWAAMTQHSLQSVSLLEPPHLHGRNLYTDVLPAFYQSSRTLAQTFADSMQGVSIRGIEQPGSMIDFARAALLDPDNRATGYYLHDVDTTSSIQQLVASRPEIGLFVTWGSLSRVSLPEINRAMLQMNPFADSRLTTGLEIPGARHDVTNYWPLGAYALREALALATK